jgi:hypothetical protein
LFPKIPCGESQCNDDDDVGNKTYKIYIPIWKWNSIPNVRKPMFSGAVQEQQTLLFSACLVNLLSHHHRIIMLNVEDFSSFCWTSRQEERRGHP